MLTECRKGPRARVYCRGGEGTPGEGLVRQTPDQASRNEDAAQIVIFYAAPHTHQAHPPIPNHCSHLPLTRSLVCTLVRALSGSSAAHSFQLRTSRFLRKPHSLRTSNIVSTPHLIRTSHLLRPTYVRPFPPSRPPYFSYCASLIQTWHPHTAYILKKTVGVVKIYSNQQDAAHY